MFKSILWLPFLCGFAVEVSADNIKLHVVTEDSPPRNYLNSDGEIVGTSTDIVKSVLNTANIDYQLTLYPWIRAYTMALEQPNVLIYTISRNPKREDKFRWFCPLPDIGDVYLYKLKKNKQIQVYSLNDAKKYRIGVTNKGVEHQFLLEQGFKEHQQLDFSANELTNFKKLFKGRIDLLVQSESTVKEHLRTLKVPRQQLEKSLLLYTTQSQPSCMALSIKTSPDIFHKLDAAFKKYQQTAQSPVVQPMAATLQTEILPTISREPANAATEYNDAH